MRSYIFCWPHRDGALRHSREKSKASRSSGLHTFVTRRALFPAISLIKIRHAVADNTRILPSDRPLQNCVPLRQACYLAGFRVYCHCHLLIATRSLRANDEMRHARTAVNARKTGCHSPEICYMKYADTGIIIRYFGRHFAAAPARPITLFKCLLHSLTIAHFSPGIDAAPIAIYFAGITLRPAWILYEYTAMMPHASCHPLFLAAPCRIIKVFPEELMMPARRRLLLPF